MGARVVHGLLLSALLFVAAGSAACSTGGNDSPSCSGAGCGHDAGRTVMRLDAGSHDDDASATDASTLSTDDIVDTVIEPADAVLHATAGGRSEIDYVVRGVLRDGRMTGPLPGRWTINNADLGALDVNTGVFLAGGTLGGRATVRVQVESGRLSLSAMTSLQVIVTQEVLAEGTPPDAPEHFAATPVVDAARAAQVVYPLDGVVMPQNVFPPEVQWLNGVAGDIFRVTLRKTNAEVVAYTAHTGSGYSLSWLVAQAGWRVLAQTDVDEVVELRVDRWDHVRDEVVSEASPVHITFARAAISGTVYYWDTGATDADMTAGIYRINDGEGTRENFMPFPPGSTATTTNCIGCHAVSPNGRYMSARISCCNNYGVVLDLTTDLSARPAPTVYPYTSSPFWWFSTWNPTSDKLIVDNSSQNLIMVDPFTGATIPTTGLSGLGRVAHPRWSPDGRSVAYIANMVGPASDNVTSGDLAVLSMTGPTTFASPHVIHTATGTTSPVDAHPTWSPDSQLIAFQHGMTARSNDPPARHASMMLIKPDGSSSIELRTASGGENAYWPQFSPFNDGGYYWLLFISRRDYGNAMRGSRGSSRQQIWVTAIRHGFDGAEDPSSVPYWLPGQNASTRSITAEWAARACRADGEDCSVDSQCCSGMCRDDGTGHSTCVVPPTEMCHVRGELCGGAGCCEGLECIANVCSNPPI